LPTLGTEFPFELVAGNHEDQAGPDGYIMNHAACLPDRVGSTGIYAAEYYFDYPATSPLVRVIMIPPDMTVEGVTYQYTAGNPRYNWLASTIDAARIAGIHWVVVGMHKVCITTGNKSCEIGTDLLNLLVEKRVDVVLQAHDHNYQRSKQLAHSATCPAISAGSYNPDCVADDGSDAVYGKGAGTAIVITGVFGMCCTSVSASDGEAGYFAVTSSASDGFTKFTVDGDQLQAQFVPSTGTFTDSFTIAGSAGDVDGDGFTASMETYLGTDAGDRCGNTNAAGTSMAWPADLYSGGVPDSTDRVTISDMTSFLGPVRRINTNPNDPAYDVRWDLSPGPSVFLTFINIQDIVQLILTTPPMFAGQRAFDGPACTG
jgi:hypothetical protein